MNDNLALAWGWIRKGGSDLADARRTVASEGPYDTACYHAQQSIEKCLKGLLAFHGQPIPRTHDLEELLDRCTSVVSSSALSAFDVADLTGYAVELRYDPEFWPSQDTAAEALALAQLVRNAVVGLLPLAEK